MTSLGNLLGQLFSILLFDTNFPLEHTGPLSFYSPSELGTLFTILIRLLGSRRGASELGTLFTVLIRCCWGGGGILKMLKHSPALSYKTPSDFKYDVNSKVFLGFCTSSCQEYSFLQRTKFSKAAILASLTFSQD